MGDMLFKLPARPAFRCLEEIFPDVFSLTRGVPVQLRKRGGAGYAIRRDAHGVTIEHGDLSDLMRALGTLMATPGLKQAGSTPAMAFRGVMLDVSRNGVVRPKALKRALVRLALLGYNHFCLYTEDTYEVKGHPLFGYRRGRYAQKDLRELDGFAARLGITMFPCIQTLGHLEQVLKLGAYTHLRDNERVVNARLEETRQLIRTLLEQSSAPYRSKLIHVGMDETWGVGRGRSFQYGKINDPRQIYLDQVKFVARTCDELGLDPMMWGDVIVGYHEQAMSRAQRQSFPRNMKVVYWDYYQGDKDAYGRRIAEYRRMGREPLCAPGLWNWNCFWPNYRKVSWSMPHFTRQAKAMGIKEMMITAWGDDGQECPFNANWPALAFFAEEIYEKESCVEDAKRRMQAITGLNYDAMVRLGDLESMPGEEEKFGSLGKCLLWEDPMAGRVSHHLGSKRLAPHYRKLARLADEERRRAPAEFSDLLFFAGCLARVLEKKADLYNVARGAYLRGDRKAIRKVAQAMPDIVAAVFDLWQARRRVWMAEFHPWGWEVLDNRFGGLMARLQTMQAWLEAFASGRVSAIEAFDDPPVREFKELGGRVMAHKHLSSLCNV